MSPLRRPNLSPLALWILVCVLLNAAGWILSALEQLNRVGYGVVLVLSGAALCWWWGRNQPQLEPGFRLSRLRRRFRRWPAIGFAALAGLAILGGVLHHPSNYDGLAYRIPRVLHWLAEGQWHWIPTEFNRVNARACGFEWLMTPLIAFTHTDRLVFLWNVVTFLLLPGMCFGVLTRLGVRRRVAAVWMWLLPTGYCFLLQVGSISNDLFGAACALAALHYALRAREAPGIGNISFALLAAALMTGSKTSNLPLMLPVLVACLPALKTLLRHPVVAAVVLMAGVLSSFLPMAALNLRYSGDWSGLKSENVSFEAGSPAVCFANNSVLIVVQNFVPPIFPFLKQWDAFVDRVIPAEFAKQTRLAFEPGGAHWELDEMQIEETAGFGFGLSVLLFVSVVAALRKRAPAGVKSQWRLWNLAIFGGAAIALAVFMAKSGLTTAARLIAPYYLFLIPALLLLPAHEDLIRRRWWRHAAVGTMLLGAMLLIVSPARPLWPAQTVLNRLVESNPRPLLLRARRVYEVYGARWDGFAPVRASLPSDVTVLGLVTYDDPETSLWRPFGARRIRHVTRHDTAATLAEARVRYILVSKNSFAWFQRDFNGWLQTINGHLEKTITLNLRASLGPAEWYLVRVDPPPQ